MRDQMQLHARCNVQNKKKGGHKLYLVPDIWSTLGPPKIDDTSRKTDKGASIYDIRTEGGGGLSQKKM